VGDAAVDISHRAHPRPGRGPLRQGNQTAPTVGDVKDAGKDLKQPSQEAISSADAAAAAQQQVAAAEKELADAEAAVHDYTAALQKSLTDAGYYKGEVDGVYGPETVDAVKALQKAHGLPVTGTVDKAADAALQSDLQAKGGAAAQEGVASTAAVQQTLKLAGYWTGPVDGNWTPELTDALKSFQKALGVEPTGTVDAATIAALEHAIAKQPGAPSQTSTSSPAGTNT